MVQFDNYHSTAWVCPHTLDVGDTVLPTATQLGVLSVQKWLSFLAKKAVSVDF